MPFLTVGGVTVEVAPGGSSRAVTEIGDRARAFDGTMRSTVRSRKKVFAFTTVPMTQAAATTLETALNGALPVAATGDRTGSINTHPEITNVEDVATSGGYRVVYHFTLHEV